MSEESSEQIISIYRSMLSAEFQKRREQNPAYSLRAFARDLQMSPAGLSRVLSGLRSLSPKAASKLMSALRFSEDEREYFLASVESEFKRSARVRLSGEEKLKKVRESLEFSAISELAFHTVRTWVHWAIFNMVDLDHFKPDPTWIARRLGLDEAAVLKAIDDLLNAGLIETNEARTTWVQKKERLKFIPKMSSGEVQEFHRQNLNLASSSLSEVDPEFRQVATFHMALDQSQLPAFKKLIEETHIKLGNQIMTDSKSKTSVYGLTVAFFPMERPK